MNCKIPFTKDIAFEKKLYEITSISLEHELNVEGDTLKGFFIVSGDFRSHEVSVNKEAFSYILPFEIDLAHDIDHDSIEFMIDDFTYEVVDSAILRVNIDFNVIGSIKEVEEEEEVFQDARDLFDDEEQLEIIDDEHLEEKEEEKSLDQRNNDMFDYTENLEVEEKIMEGEIMMNDSLDKIEVKKETVKTDDTIIESMNGIEEEYTTYHIHMVSNGETVETICTMYNSNMSILAEYNDLTNINSGDKLIIPKTDE